MKCPQTLAKINAEMIRRRDAGLTTRYRDMRFEVLEDDDVGLFARITFEMTDGGEVTIDTQEMLALLVQARENAKQIARPH